jgi:hypothetical protein
MLFQDEIECSIWRSQAVALDDVKKLFVEKAG